MASDPLGFWVALREQARGFRYTVCGKFSKDPATRKHARESERKNEARQKLVFEI
jgi:hypothetical protein